ncbi:hypothetical protein [Butyricimonas sp.]|uniref:hypothetical protein n=1 Tax=Butyricimonas sp. TaxID=1969738 RepID=UPI0025B82DC2|nr:hypothetical protein [Butyricimonas sp.]
MKKGQKIILWSICLVICIYYLTINYIRYKYNGYNNIRIGISNVREYPIAVEIFLDNKKILQDTFQQTAPHLSIPYVINVSPGSHVIKFIMDEDVYETKIFVLFVKYLYVEYTGIPKRREGPIIFYSKCTLPYSLGKTKQLTIE